MDSLRGPSLLVNLSGSLPLSPQFSEWALRERHLAIPSPTAGCFHSQPEGMRGGDSERNPRVGPLKAAERRWDPSGESRHLPVVPAQKAQICSLPPYLCLGSLLAELNQSWNSGGPTTVMHRDGGRGGGPVPWHTAQRRVQEGHGQIQALACSTRMRHLSHPFPGKPFLASLCLEVLLCQ